jgi:hypothetical protein
MIKRRGGFRFGLKTAQVIRIRRKRNGQSFNGDPAVAGSANSALAYHNCLAGKNKNLESLSGFKRGFRLYG